MEVEEARALLGLERGATERDIRRRCSRLMPHPDALPAAERPAAEERYKRLSEAKHILIRVARGECPDTRVVGTAAPHAASSVVAGVDLLADVTLPWLTALRGGPTSMSVARGGQMVKLHVEVPPDTQPGRRIRVPGAGGAGMPPGDLYLHVVRVESQKTWARDGLTLRTEIEVTYAQIYNERIVGIPTPWGPGHVALQLRRNFFGPYTIASHGVRTAEGRAGDLVVALKVLWPEADAELGQVLQRVQHESG